jgi:uncharacterized membrane protein
MKSVFPKRASSRTRFRESMRGLSAKAAYGILTLLSVLVAVYSMRFVAVSWNVWIAVGPEIREVIEHVPWQALTHMIAAPIALVVGPFQFLSGLRARRPALHRWLGRIYATTCLIAAAAGFATAFFASGGAIASVGFGLLAIFWFVATAAAWRAAVNRNFTLHRRLMRYSFAMTFAAVTLRLQIPIGVIFFDYKSYQSLSVWLAYTSWIPNVLAVYLYEQMLARRDRAPIALD